MDGFAIAVFGVLAAIVLILVAIGLRSPRRPSEVFNRDSEKVWGEIARVEEQEVGQMVEGQNAYRRRSGREEVTEQEVRGRIGREQAAELDQANREMRTGPKTSESIQRKAREERLRSPRTGDLPTARNDERS